MLRQAFHFAELYRCSRATARAALVSAAVLICFVVARPGFAGTTNSPITGYTQSFAQFCAEIHASPDLPSLDRMSARVRELGGSLRDIAKEDERASDQRREAAETLKVEVDKASAELAYLWSRQNSFRRAGSLVELLNSKLLESGRRYAAGQAISLKIDELLARLRDAHGSIDATVHDRQRSRSILDPRYWIKNPFRTGNISGAGGVDADGMTGNAIQQALDAQRALETQFVQATAAYTGRSFAPTLNGALRAIEAEERENKAQLQAEHVKDDAEWAGRIHIAEARYAKFYSSRSKADDDYVTAARAYRQSEAMASLFERMQSSIQTCINDRRRELGDSPIARDNRPADVASAGDAGPSDKPPANQDTPNSDSGALDGKFVMGRQTTSCPGGEPKSGPASFTFGKGKVLIAIETPQGKGLYFGAYPLDSSGAFRGSRGTGANLVRWEGQFSFGAKPAGSGHIEFFLDFGSIAEAAASAMSGGGARGPARQQLIACRIEWKTL